MTRSRRAVRRPFRRCAAATFVLAALAAGVAAPAQAKPVGPGPEARTRAPVLVAAPAPARPARTAGPASAGFASAVVMPAACRTAVTMVLADTAAATGVVAGATGSIDDLGVQLGFTPRAISLARMTTLGADRTAQYLAVDPGGPLQKVTVTTTVDRNGVQTRAVSTAAVGRGWGAVRQIAVVDGILYAITDSGALNRYTITADFRVRSAGQVRATGFGGVRSIASTGLWVVGRTPRGTEILADGLIGATRSGALVEYLIPRVAYSAMTADVLAKAGWQGYRHVSTGACGAVAVARPIVAVTFAGDAVVYLDRNGDDGSGQDIRYGGIAARGWTGVLGD